MRERSQAVHFNSPTAATFSFPGGCHGTLVAFNSHRFGASPTASPLAVFLKSDGEDFVAMSKFEFGHFVSASSPPSQTNPFAHRKGAANPYPLIGPVIINEHVPPAGYWNE